MRSLRTGVMVTYLWVNMILFGALVFETTIMYPDFFHDVPRSLAVSTEFMAVTGPGDFFRPVGMATVTLGLVALAVMWRTRPVVGWVAASVVVLLTANGVFSILYFWPANTVMFTEGLAVHSPAVLREVAAGFVGWNVVRLAGCAAATVCAFVAFLRFHRGHVAATTYRPEAERESAVEGSTVPSSPTPSSSSSTSSSLR